MAYKKSFLALVRTFSLGTFSLGTFSLGLLVASGSAHAIVGGELVEQCGWPTTLATRGCTATLIHPRAISTAQHCGIPTEVFFGEDQRSPARQVSVLGCVGTGSQDAQICELAEAVTDIPVTPALFGCELDKYMTVGQPVVLAGFGLTSFNGQSDGKRWVSQKITAVEAGRVIIGNAAEGQSPCQGDSGGPVFVQVDDGSWRVFGTVLGGTTNIPCNSAADFQRIDTVVANFETARGLDITPCFDAQTGVWQPSAECTGFYAGDHEGFGTWSDSCTGTPIASFSEQCGAAFGAEDPGENPDAGVPGEDPNGNESGGCATSGSTRGTLLPILFFGWLLFRRRRGVNA